MKYLHILALLAVFLHFSSGHHQSDEENFLQPFLSYLRYLNVPSEAIENLYKDADDKDEKRQYYTTPQAYSLNYPEQYYIDATSRDAGIYPALLSPSMQSPKSMVSPAFQQFAIYESPSIVSPYFWPHNNQQNFPIILISPETSLQNQEQEDIGEEISNAELDPIFIADPEIIEAMEVTKKNPSKLEIVTEGKANKSITKNKRGTANKIGHSKNPILEEMLAKARRRQRVQERIAGAIFLRKLNINRR